MKASIPRLGNYVLAIDNVFGEVFGIDGMEITMLNYPYTDIIPFTQPVDVLKGIPRNEGWLAKFGFDKSIRKLDRNGGEYWSDIGLVLVNDDVDNPEWGYLFTMNGESLIVVKYVHQLQNLYFALSGEELTFKE